VTRADGTTRIHAQSRWYDTRCEGTHRARERGVQGSAWVCHGLVEGGAMVTVLDSWSVAVFARFLCPRHQG
jgi:hypothetical protein